MKEISLKEYQLVLEGRRQRSGFSGLRLAFYEPVAHHGPVTAPCAQGFRAAWVAEVPLDRAGNLNYRQSRGCPPRDSHTRTLIQSEGEGTAT